MNLLIYGGQEDYHALAVAWAMRSLGHSCEIVEYHRYPAEVRGSFEIGLSSPQTVSTMSGDCAVDHFTFDIVWNRRAGPVNLPAFIHKDDAEVARLHAHTYLCWIRALARPGQIWVNPREAQARADNKLHQLALAESLGLRVPRTLVSNDPERIRAFAREHDEIIVKPLRPAVWEESGIRRAMPTCELTDLDARPDRSMIGAPMIYQSKIEKAHELRVVLFGAELLAVRLYSQSRAATRVDFRIGDPDDLDVELDTLDPLTEQALLQFARRMGIVHGSFDLAVGPTGEVTFFELNEQGQTLWIEDANPSIRMLDRLVAFLSDPSGDFRWDGVPQFALNDYMQTIEVA